MSGIYDMNYEDFKKLCWYRWGIEVSQSWPTDVYGKVTDRRKCEYTVKFPVVDDEGIHFVGDRLTLHFGKLRDAIWKISHDRKINKDYYKKLEGYMAEINKPKDPYKGGYVHE